MTKVNNIRLASFADAEYVCNAVHYQDQSFHWKLLRRKDGCSSVECKYVTGTYAEHSRNFLADRSAGWEVFMMLAVTDGVGHTSDHITHTWAVAIDLDGDVDIDAWLRHPYRPSLIIETSPGRYHLVWIFRVPLSKQDAHQLLTAMATRFNADRTFANVTQAIRLPGFINGKHGNEVLLLDWSDSQRTYAVEELRLAFDVDLVVKYLRDRQPRFTPSLGLNKQEVSKPHLIEDLQSALKCIVADEYGVWFRVGMALSILGEDGYQLWADWSQTSTNCNPSELPGKWKSFHAAHTISVASIFAMAMSNGWSNPGFRNADHKPGASDQITERAVGQLLASKMRDLFATIPNDGRSRHAYLLLQWDDQKYTVLSDIERRKVIERYVRDVTQERAESKEFVRFLVQKSASNRALDDLSEHVCEFLFDNSTACPAASYPYFSVANGVLNLLSRELVPSFLRPLSMVTGRVTYDSSAKAEMFMKTLAEIFEDDQAMIRAVIRLLGMALTGNPKEHIFVIFFGPTGRNGKTLIVEVCREIFGDYAQAIPTSVILAKSHNNEGPTPAVAKLVGKRLAIISEPSDKHPLDSGFIKLMTGGESITARQLHGQMLEFKPEFVPLLVTNVIPAVREDDHALWRRTKIVKFTRTFSDDEIDTDLKEKLTREKSGILNLLLDGIEDYKANGLSLPDKIKSAGVEQRKEFDPFEAWHEECLIACDNMTETPLQALYPSYESWAQENRQYRRLTKKELSSKLVARGYQKVDRRRYPHFCGIALKEDAVS